MLHLQFPNLINNHGCWIVGTRSFLKKIEALEYASRLKTKEVYFYYHNYIWENFDRSQLGKTSLDELYKQRAQQLRDQYKHLVLHFSGGSDSYNILYTFLKHNIPLDEIVIKWPKFVVEKNLYVPNANDISARNSLSEWDFAIKPVLDRIAVLRPEIKITVVDYGKNLLNKNHTENLEKKLEIFLRNRYQVAGFFMMLNPDLYQPIYDPATTAHIFGVEKPVLSYDSVGIYFHFIDSAFDMLTVNPELGNKEPFYWSKDLPLLPAEQAYQTALALISDNRYKSFALNAEKNQSLNRSYRILQIQNSVFKRILYEESWNQNTFQVKKPRPDCSDWYHWIFENPEFRGSLETYYDSLKTLTYNLDNRWFKDPENLKSGLTTLKTKGFKILDLS